jgi:hypothetical protein
VKRSFNHETHEAHENPFGVHALACLPSESDGDKVVEFPRLPEMQQVTLKVLRWDERDKHLVIKEAQIVA